jgi:F-type H+-transporting ATPase subunit delta
MARPASARRYAQAVFEIARDKGQFDLWRSDLKRIAESVSITELLAVMESPKVSFQDKQKLMAQQLEGISPLALNLVYLLTARGRLGLADPIADEYGRLVDANRGIKHVLVTTAVPLEAAEQEKLRQALSKFVKGQVILESQVDPKIIGGLVARMEDKLLDGSVSSRLEALKRNLSGISSKAAK